MIHTDCNEQYSIKAIYLDRNVKFQYEKVLQNNVDSASTVASSVIED